MEKGPKPEVSIVIVSYNSLPHLRACIESIPGGAGSLPYEVIIVDNNSSDGTPDVIRNEAPSVNLIANTENLGFAKGCNIGIKAARGRYILLLNPDTVVGSNALERTHEYLEDNPDLAAAGCKLLRPDGSLDPSCKRELPSPWDAFCRMVGLSKLFPRSRIFARYDAAYLDVDKRQRLPLIDGCYMMMRSEALKDIGLFDERFFIYGEDVDWCRRAHSGGWSIGYDPTGTVVHMKGETTRHYTFRMLYHFHRSMTLYYWKHSRRWDPVQLIVYPGIALRLAALVIWNLFRRERRVSG